MRVYLAAAALTALSLVFLPAGHVQAAPVPAKAGGVTVAVGCSPSAGCGVLLVTCGPGGQVTAVVRLAGTPPLLPLGGLTVRLGDRCGPSAAAPPSSAPATVPPTSGGPPSTGGPTGGPTTAPTGGPTGGPAPSGPATTGSSAPAVTAAPATSPTAAGPGGVPAPGAGPTSASGPGPGPGPGAPAARTSPRPAAFGPTTTAPGPAGTAGYAPPPMADEPYDRGSGAAARWWLMTMAVVLLPAALAALPYRQIRRRH